MFVLIDFFGPSLKPNWQVTVAMGVGTGGGGWSGVPSNFPSKRDIHAAILLPLSGSYIYISLPLLPPFRIHHCLISWDLNMNIGHV